MLRPVHWITGWRLWLLWPVVQILRLWTASLRIETPTSSIPKRPTLIIFFHNRLFCAAELYQRLRQDRKMSGLVSASKDGAWLSAVFQLLGIRAIRGSSSYRGVQALREILRVMAHGYDFAITPDGPRGPKYRIAPGALKVAEATGSPIILASWHYHSAWQLGSWDGFYIPKPFSRVTLRYQYYPSITALQLAAKDDELPAYIQRILIDLGEPLAPAL